MEPNIEDQEVAGEEVLVRDMAFGDNMIFLNEETLVRLKSNDPAITNVCITIIGVDTFDWVADGGAIGENTRLRSLRVEFAGIEDGYDIENNSALYGAISRNRSIVSLSLNNSPINDADVVDNFLRPFFEQNQHLRSFDISEVETSERFAWALVSALSRCTMLQELGVSYTGDEYDEFAAMIIINSLLNMHPDLRRFDYNFGMTGSLPCGALSRLLRNPASRLEHLNLYDNNIDDEGAILLVDGLAGNLTLERLNLDESYGLTENGWRGFFDRLLGVLCNKSSITTVQASNHTLWEIEVDPNDVDVPEDIPFLLNLNRSPNNVAVHQKIIKYYFSNGQSHMEVLLGLEREVSPHAIAYMGRYPDGIPLLYQFIRQYNAELFLGGADSNDDNGGSEVAERSSLS